MMYIETIVSVVILMIIVVDMFSIPANNRIYDYFGHIALLNLFEQFY
jgi:hypothetical protein